MAHSPPARDAIDILLSENLSPTYLEDSESHGEAEEDFQGEMIPFTANQGELVSLITSEYSAPPKTAEDVFIEKAGPRAYPWLIENEGILAAANEMGPERGAEFFAYDL